MLNAPKERMCEIRVLDHDDFGVRGMFLGENQCTSNELSDMAGFITNISMYKLCVIVESDGIVPI